MLTCSGVTVSINIKRANIKKIDINNKIIEFNPKKHGKITGSRFLSVLGKNKYVSEFQAACLIARLFWDDTTTKYTEAGNIIEPILRSYVRENWGSLLADKMFMSSYDKVIVEDPINKKDCYYDHFMSNNIFGGMVDGYICLNGNRDSVLEIKTSSDRTQWCDDNGNDRIPEDYYLQASLYAELAGLKRIVFAVAFLQEKDYDFPEMFVPTPDNTKIFVVEKKNISEEMRTAEEWFKKYIEKGVTPKWSENDENIVDILVSDKIDRMPDEVMMYFRKYIEMYGEGADLTDINAHITELMTSVALDGAKSLTYEQNGFHFELSLDGIPKLTVTRT